jgi:hypothetical protein
LGGLQGRICSGGRWLGQGQLDVACAAVFIDAEVHGHAELGRHHASPVVEVEKPVWAVGRCDDADFFLFAESENLPSHDVSFLVRIEYALQCLAAFCYKRMQLLFLMLSAGFSADCVGVRKTVGRRGDTLCRGDWAIAKGLRFRVHYVIGGRRHRAHESMKKAPVDVVHQALGAMVFCWFTSPHPPAGAAAWPGRWPR